MQYNIFIIHTLKIKMYVTFFIYCIHTLWRMN